MGPIAGSRPRFGHAHLAARINTVAKHGATGDPHLGRQGQQPPAGDPPWPHIAPGVNFGRTDAGLATGRDRWLEPQPTSTPSSSTTRPVWGISPSRRRWVRNQKPSAPITAFDWMTQPKPRSWLPGWSTALAWDLAAFQPAARCRRALRRDGGCKPRLTAQPGHRSRRGAPRAPSEARLAAGSTTALGLIPAGLGGLGEGARGLGGSPGADP